MPLETQRLLDKGIAFDPGQGHELDQFVCHLSDVLDERARSDHMRAKARIVQLFPLPGDCSAAAACRCP